MSDAKTIIKPQAGFQEKFVRSNVDFVVGGGILGSGKAGSLDSHVVTPFGLRKVRDLKVGDIISNPDTGGQEFIIQLHPIEIHPYYRVSFDDGTYMDCSEGHLWVVRVSGKKDKRIKEGDKFDCYRLWTTKMMFDFLSKDRAWGLSIPVTKPVQFTRPITPTTPRPVPPYVLGAIIGDGCVSSSMVNSRSCVGFSSADDFIVEKIASYGYDMSHSAKKGNSICKDYFIYQRLPSELESLGLYEIKSKDKFIPERYKFSTIEERCELLQGLIDTDGSVDDEGHITYYTISKRLAEDVAFLVRSIGGIAHISSKQGKYKDKEGNLHICSKVYNVYISVLDGKKIVSLPRKVERIKDYGYKNGKKLYFEKPIKKIEYIGRKKGRCITVDNPSGLYLTDDFIVTHNSFAAVLSVAEPSLDPNFRGLFLRNNLGDLRSGGGILDNFREAFGNSIDVVESGEPRVTFPSGARIDVTHVSDQSREKVLQRFKGRQYDYIYFDEGTGFTWDCFTAIYTRNRGKAKWTGKVRMTTNPDRDHWLRQFLDWYIGIDGFIMEERNGVVRYFYIAGETVKDVVWGDSKEEVYKKCRVDINRKLAKINGNSGTTTYEDLIKSFTFYLGKMSENKAMLEGNDGYAGSVAVMGGRSAQQLLEGNWNVSASDSLDAPITSEKANSVFLNDPQVNGDRWITCDLADTGEDNFIALAWDGFHVVDIVILSQTTPKMNAEVLKEFAKSHDVADSHIIYDAVRGIYINDYIPEAIPFISYHAPMGVYARGALRLKDECYLRVIEMINRGELSFADNIADKVYVHKNLKDRITVQNEFVEECQVVRFRESTSGKKTLFGKKEMNIKLGKRRSMDLLDPIAMRMVPVLEFPYGEELSRTAVEPESKDEDGDIRSMMSGSIYDDSTWY